MTEAAHAISLTIFTAAMALLTSVGIRTQRRTVARCGICHYDMRGLPLQAPCPECGHRTRDEVIERLTLRFKWRVYLASMVVISAAGLVAAINIRPLWEALYRLDGYAPEVIERVMAWSGGGGASYVGVFVAACVWIIVPWRIKRRTPVIATGIAVAVVATLTTLASVWMAWRQGGLHPPEGVGVLSAMFGAIAGVAVASVNSLRRGRRRRRRSAAPRQAADG